MSEDKERLASLETRAEGADKDRDSIHSLLLHHSKKLNEHGEQLTELREIGRQNCDNTEKLTKITGKIEQDVHTIAVKNAYIEGKIKAAAAILLSIGSVLGALFAAFWDKLKALFS